MAHAELAILALSILVFFLKLSSSTRAHPPPSQTPSPPAAHCEP